MKTDFTLLLITALAVLTCLFFENRKRIKGIASRYRVRRRFRQMSDRIDRARDWFELRALKPELDELCWSQSHLTGAGWHSRLRLSIYTKYHSKNNFLTPSPVEHFR